MMLVWEERLTHNDWVQIIHDYIDVAVMPDGSTVSHRGDGQKFVVKYGPRARIFRFMCEVTGFGTLREALLFLRSEYGIRLDSHTVAMSILAGGIPFRIIPK